MTVPLLGNPRAAEARAREKLQETGISTECRPTRLRKKAEGPSGSVGRALRSA